MKRAVLYARVSTDAQQKEGTIKSQVLELKRQITAIFEMFASSRYGLVTISRFLEERRVPTRLGRPQWDRGQIKAML
jgi:DNA invertase Pin-like site-specific DNA recombinase